MIARYFRVATKLKIREMSGKLKTVKENSGNFSKFSGKLEYLALKKSTAFSSKCYASLDKNYNVPKTILLSKQTTLIV